MIGVYAVFKFRNVAEDGQNHARVVPAGIADGKSESRGNREEEF